MYCMDCIYYTKAEWSKKAQDTEVRFDNIITTVFLSFFLSFFLPFFLSSFLSLSFSAYLVPPDSFSFRISILNCVWNSGFGFGFVRYVLYVGYRFKYRNLD